MRTLAILMAFSLAASSVACSKDSSGVIGVNPNPNNPGTPAVRPTLPTNYVSTGLAASGEVSVQLFEWGWADVARECELHLGPMGYKAALVSPPQEHITGGAWWTRYQPVSYSLDQNRSGTRAQFIDMVSRCRAVNVDIYVDAVINHMTAGSGTGSNGTVYTKYSYPGLYNSGDFHPACGITDWDNAVQVQDCELVGLSDLSTGTASVQQKIVAYLAELVDLGVRGFRIDAAKHIQPVQLDSIVTKLNRAASASGDPNPYIFLEIIDMGGGGVRATQYYGVGFHGGSASDVSEFKFRGIGDKFQGVGGQKVAELSTFSPGNWGLIPSDKGMSFIQNHDTQRAGGLRWSDGDMARLANVFMLADPYGYPMIMSGYSFDATTQGGRDAGPPPNTGTPTGQTCATDLTTAPVGVWLCEHRDPWIGQMIAFRQAVSDVARTNNWDNGAQAVAFSRGGLGFVIINNATTPITATMQTGLSVGNYCNFLTADLGPTGCNGTVHVVGADGRSEFTVGARSAVVLMAGYQP